MADKEKTERREKSKTLKEQFLDRISDIKKDSRKRNFVQSWDISVAVKGLDLKKPENRFTSEFILPAGREKKLKTVLIADTLATEGKKHADLVITKNDFEKISKNKKKLKSIANEYEWFLGEVSMMPLIGKHFGAVLGPRGKAPKPVPPNVKLEPFMEAVQKNVRISLRDTPVIHVAVGTEDMEDSKIAANAEAVVNFVKSKLPKGKNNIKSVHIKLTMSKPARVEVL